MLDSEYSPPSSSQLVADSIILAVSFPRLHEHSLQHIMRFAGIVLALATAAAVVPSLACVIHACLLRLPLTVSLSVPVQSRQDWYAREFDDELEARNYVTASPSKFRQVLGPTFHLKLSAATLSHLSHKTRELYNEFQA